MKECYLYKKISDKKVQCLTCNHYCVIAENERGKCKVRQNVSWKLYSLNYKKACALAIDPIEKKPLYHFLAGSYTLSLAAAGCNFSCLNCQNWQISQSPKISPERKIEGKEISPKQIVETAIKNNLPSISYTYTEPTIFLEYALDTMKLARENGLKNIWVSNGFFSKETFHLILPYLDAANIDLKSFDNKFYQKICQGRLLPVLDNLKRLKKNNVHLEITTLVIPDLNDSKDNFKKIAHFIACELGTDTPWHISRFLGLLSWKLQNIQDTSFETLKKAEDIGRKAGLKYVYLGNV